MRVHIAEKPYQCTQCDKCFLKDSPRQDYMRKQIMEKPYLYIQCGNALSCCDYLNMYMKAYSVETTQMPPMWKDFLYKQFPNKKVYENRNTKDLQ